MGRGGQAPEAAGDSDPAFHCSATKPEFIECLLYTESHSDAGVQLSCSQ